MHSVLATQHLQERPGGQYLPYNYKSLPAAAGIFDTNSTIIAVFTTRSPHSRLFSPVHVHPITRVGKGYLVSVGDFYLFPSRKKLTVFECPVPAVQIH